MKRITKKEWQVLGGISGTKVCRKMIFGKWFYYRID